MNSKQRKLNKNADRKKRVRQKVLRRRAFMRADAARQKAWEKEQSES